MHPLTLCAASKARGAAPHRAKRHAASSRCSMAPRRPCILAAKQRCSHSGTGTSQQPHKLSRAASRLVDTSLVCSLAVVSWWCRPNTTENNQRTSVADPTHTRAHTQPRGRCGTNKTCAMLPHRDMTLHMSLQCKQTVALPECPPVVKWDLTHMPAPQLPATPARAALQPEHACCLVLSAHPTALCRARRIRTHRRGAHHTPRRASHVTS
jgi:hypothetical protein